MPTSDPAPRGRLAALSARLAGLPRPARWLVLAALLATLVAVNRLSLERARQARDRVALAEQGEVLYVPDTRLLRLMTLGYDQAAADLMWIRTLEYFARHFTTDRRYRWLEFFLDQVIELDPDFVKVYHWAGATVLYGRRFTEENIELSSRFYRRALARDPDDYEAAYRLGLNHYIELPSALIRGAAPGDTAARAEAERHRERGLAYLEQAANAPGAPDRMRNLVAAISSRLGNHQLALQYLIDLYIQTDDPDRKTELRQRIDALRAEGADGALAEAAADFERSWKTTYPYVPPAVFAAMGEPAGPGVADVDWRTLLPGVTLADPDAAPLDPAPPDPAPKDPAP